MADSCVVCGEPTVVAVPCSAACRHEARCEIDMALQREERLRLRGFDGDDTAVLAVIRRREQLQDALGEAPRS